MILVFPKEVFNATLKQGNKIAVGSHRLMLRRNGIQVCVAYNIETHLIAQLIKIGHHRRMLGGAHSIDIIEFHALQCCTYLASICMAASVLGREDHTLEGHRFTVDLQHAIFHFDPAEAEAGTNHFHLLHFLVAEA